MKAATLAVLDVLIFPVILISLLAIAIALAVGYGVGWLMNGFDK
jgi:hypothetical protein